MLYVQHVRPSFIQICGLVRAFYYTQFTQMAKIGAMTKRDLSYFMGLTLIILGIFGRVDGTAVLGGTILLLFSSDININKFYKTND